MVNEPKRFSARHWWNYVTLLLAVGGIGLWAAGAFDGRLLLGMLLLWLILGLALAPSILYEHLGFLDRWLFNDYQKAHTRYRKAVDTKAATPQAYAALGSLAYAEGDLVEATRLLEEALTQLPHDAHLHFLLSRSLSRQGRYDQAISEAVTTGKLSRDSFLGDLALGSALADKSDYVAAAAAYQKAIEKRPDLLPARLGLARCYLNMGRLDAAREQVDEALRLGPQNPDTLYWAGRVAIAENRRRDADRFLQASLGARPVHDQAHLVPYKEVVATLCEARENLLGPHFDRK